MSMNMEVFDAKEQAESSDHKPAKKGGRKPTLTEDQKRERRIKACAKYRLNINNKHKRSEAENKSLKEKVEVLQSDMEVLQSEKNTWNKELSEIKAQVNKLAADFSAKSEIVNMGKKEFEKLNAGIEQMQHDFLTPVVQDHHVRNLESNNITSDHVLFKNLENLEVVTNHPELLWSQTIGCLFGGGTSIAETKLSSLDETLNVEGLRVLKENSPMIQEIFREYPNIASGLRVRYPASRNGFMNTLAEVYKMATIERGKCNLEDVKHMEDGIEDLEFAGLDVSWLKHLVAESRKEVEDEEKIKSTKAELTLLEERQSKRREERESKRQRFSST